MTTATDSHPTPDELRRFGVGALDPPRQAEVERHVANCDACCDVLRHAPDDSLVGALKANGGGAPVEPIALVRPVDARSAPIPAALRDHPRFRILKTIGAGGMGVVYKAEHRFMERLVALKVINGRLIGNPTALERFRLELKAAARLSHPNIVTAYDAEQAGDLQMLVMEYVDGISVARQVEKAGPLSVRHACQFARQAAFGLQHAYERGMVHRDVKPQNLMLTRDGRVKILDFGLARFVRESEPPAANAAAAEASSPKTSSTGDTAPGADGLTHDGAALGTPDYMAPEQVLDARTADIRADIYALGGTLYWMLAGHSPFPHGSVADKLESQLDRQPLDLSFVRTDVPEALRRVIARMTAKNPDDRYQTPVEAAEALAPFCKPGPVVAPASLAGPVSNVSPPGAVRSLAGSLAGSFVRAFRWRVGPGTGTSSGRRTAVVAIACAVAGLVGLALLLFSAPNSSDGSPDRATASARLESGLRESVRAASTEASAGVARRPGADRTAVLIVVPRRDVSATEVELVRRAIRYFGSEPRIASSTRDAVRAVADGGAPAAVSFDVDVALDGVDPSQYSGVVILGAQRLESFDHRLDASYAARLRELLRRFQTLDRPIAAFGAGVRVPAELGLLEGRQAARIAGAPRDPAWEAHARWTAERVVVDGRLLTGADRYSIKELLERLTAFKD